MALSIPRDTRKRYQGDGFYLSPPIIPVDLIDRITVSMDEVMAGSYETGMAPRRAWNPGDDTKKIRKLDQTHLSNHAIYELASHPEIGRWAATLMNADRIQLWASQMLYKPPGGMVTGSVGWHQDKQYWENLLDGELFTAWVAVSNVTEDSGPLKFVLGSHRWGFLQSGDFFGHDHEAQKKNISVPEGEKWEEVTAVLPPGAVSFHDCHTYHASGPNISPVPRRSFAFHLRTEKSWPVKGRNDYYLQHLDDPHYCPILYER